MAFCRRCPQYLGHNTGSRFKDEINLVVATLGIHYAGHERVKAERTHQDKEKLKIYQKKFNYKDAFTDYVQQMMHWIPKSVTHCPTKRGNGRAHYNSVKAAGCTEVAGEV